jgi:hypothetical protein
MREALLLSTEAFTLPLLGECIQCTFFTDYVAVGALAVARLLDEAVL